MKLMKKLAVGAIAVLMGVSMIACSTESAASMNELVNTRLAQSGSSYTVTGIDATADATVSLIKEAAATYANYKNSLTNTDDLAADLDDDGESTGTIANAVRGAKYQNLQTLANFEQSLKSFNDRGIGAAYTVTNENVSAGVYDEQAVANYVASQLTGSAKVYVSDVIEVPTLDDSEGTYTGNTTPMRYVYVEYVNQ